MDETKRSLYEGMESLPFNCTKGEIMKVQYYFRHMDSSNALMYEFEHKTENLEPLIQTSSPINVTFMVENGQHKIHVELHARTHTLIELTEVSEDMHKSIDLVVDTLTKALTREKSKQTHHHVKQDRFQAAMAASTVTVSDDEFFDDLDVDEGVKSLA